MLKKQIFIIKQKCHFRNMKLTSNECIKSLKELYASDIVMIGDFKGEKRKTIFKCVRHGEFEQTPYQLITNKVGCPLCSNEVRKSPKGYWEFLENCQNEANKYDDIKTLALNSPFCYFTIVKNGWKNKIKFK